MKKITINKGKFKLEDKIEIVIEGKVKPIGNGGMVLAPKKHIGKGVYILIKKN